ncbi:hypothetical protein GJ496_007113 [Pomphorhynchus laevis]|nr:hypothetical protein GJ496_007113 [Pomphorhynchus laevis]
MNTTVKNVAISIRKYVDMRQSNALIIVHAEAKYCANANVLDRYYINANAIERYYTNADALECYYTNANAFEKTSDEMFQQRGDKRCKCCKEIETATQITSSHTCFTRSTDNSIAKVKALSTHVNAFTVIVCNGTE